MFVNVTLQDLPLEILLEIAKLHPWVGCNLAYTVRKVGLYSLENDTKRWFKIEKENETFILVKSSKESSYYKKWRHSWDDAPARIFYDNSQEWYKKGNLHRDGDKPAIIDANGAKFWFKDGSLHREGDNPAVTYSDGSHYWYKEGFLHRDDNKPVISPASHRDRPYISNI